MTKILLIRHATTDLVGKRLAGRITGVRLNAEGRVQAAGLAERLRHLPINAIYSSPLERAVETAEPLAAKLSLPIQIQDELTELDFGKWTNVEIESLRGEEQFQLFNLFRSSTRVPGGEWMMSAQTRMIVCLQRLCQQHPNETIAVVSHSDLIKAVVAHYAGIHLDLMQRIEIDPSSVSIIDVYPETARISRLNDTGEIQV